MVRAWRSRIVIGAPGPRAAVDPAVPAGRRRSRRLLLDAFDVVLGRCVAGLLGEATRVRARVPGARRQVLDSWYLGIELFVAWTRWPERALRWTAASLFAWRFAGVVRVRAHRRAAAAARVPQPVRELRAQSHATTFGCRARADRVRSRTSRRRPPSRRSRPPASRSGRAHRDRPRPPRRAPRSRASGRVAAAHASSCVARQDDFLFVLVPGGRRFDWPKLRAAPGHEPPDAADAEEAKAETGYERGAITPFGALRPGR